jgi:hypothetical protein
MLAAQAMAVVWSAAVVPDGHAQGLIDSIHAVTGQPCANMFIDVGSHTGGSLWNFYNQRNCYEVCGGDATCQPGNWSSTSCKFCNTANMARQCGWMWPWWLPLEVRQKYCGVAFEPNPNSAAKLEAKVAELRARVPGISVRVYNDTAVSVRDGEAPFGIDEGAYEGRSSSLVLSRLAPTLAAPGEKCALAERSAACASRIAAP